MFTRIILSLSLSLVIIAAAMMAEAQTLQLGNPAYGGTGCPAGSASVTAATDGTAISILFDSFVAEAGKTTGRRLDRKSCNIAIPVAVPQGYSVAIFSVDYRGFVAVPRGGQVKLDSEYFWAGSRGPHTSRNFLGPSTDNYTVTDDLMASTIIWAPCGASVNLRINSSMMAMANSAMDQTIGSVDSADVTSALIYHIQWRRCSL